MITDVFTSIFLRCDIKTITNLIYLDKRSYEQCKHKNLWIYKFIYDKLNYVSDDLSISNWIKLYHYTHMIKLRKNDLYRNAEELAYTILHTGLIELNHDVKLYKFIYIKILPNKEQLIYKILSDYKFPVNYFNTITLRYGYNHSSILFRKLNFPKNQFTSFDERDYIEKYDDITIFINRRYFMYLIMVILYDGHYIDVTDCNRLSYLLKNLGHLEHGTSKMVERLTIIQTIQYFSDKGLKL